MNTTPENTSSHRKCTDCKEVFPLIPENFHRSRNRLHGFEYKCKRCEKIRSKVKNINRRGKPRFKNLSSEQKTNRYRIARRYYQTDVGKCRIRASSYRRVDKGKLLENDIDWSFILNYILKAKCEYCGIENGDLGCDRVDNTKGHLKNNTVPCCYLCNQTRLDNYSYREMKLLGRSIKQIREKRKFSISFDSLEEF